MCLDKLLVVFSFLISGFRLLSGFRICSGWSLDGTNIGYLVIFLFNFDYGLPQYAAQKAFFGCKREHGLIIRCSDTDQSRMATIVYCSYLMGVSDWDVNANFHEL